jgi:hypothetical protein
VEDDEISNGFVVVAGQEKPRHERDGVDSGILLDVLLYASTSLILWK